MGRNNSDFHGVNYKYEFFPEGSHPAAEWNDQDLHEVTAHLNGQKVGSLTYNTADDDGDAYDIVVHPDHQRKGIATGMWNYAKQLHRQGVTDTPPRHSPRTTAEGYRWAMTTGDPVPQRFDELVEDDEEEGILPGPKDNKWRGR